LPQKIIPIAVQRYGSPFRGTTKERRDPHETTEPLARRPRSSVKRRSSIRWMTRRLSSVPCPAVSGPQIAKSKSLVIGVPTNLQYWGSPCERAPDHHRYCRGRRGPDANMCRIE
jgi:hypothetical protein